MIVYHTYCYYYQCLYLFLVSHSCSHVLEHQCVVSPYEVMMDVIVEMDYQDLLEHLDEMWTERRAWHRGIIRSFWTNGT